MISFPLFLDKWEGDTSLPPCSYIGHYLVLASGLWVEVTRTSSCKSIPFTHGRRYHAFYRDGHKTKTKPGLLNCHGRWLTWRISCTHINSRYTNKETFAELSNWDFGIACNLASPDWYKRVHGKYIVEPFWSENIVIPPSHLIEELNIEF